MTRHVRRASALILASALFAAGAWGQTTTLRQWADSIDVASEYFGTADGRELGRDVKGEDNAPMVTITVHDDTAIDGGGVIGVGNIARITYTLKGATFAETVSASNLTGAQLGGSAALETEIVEGGAEGDSSVTIEVEVAGGNITGDTDVGNHMAVDPTDTDIPKIMFEVPMLQATGTVLSSDPTTGRATAVGVAITSSIAVRRARDNPFPGRIQGADADHVTGDSPAVGPKVDAIGVDQSQVYNTMMPALSFSWAAPYSVTEQVDVRNRQVIIPLGAMAKDPSVRDQSEAGPALRVGQINITTPSTIPMDLGGEDPAVVTTDNADPPAPLAASDYELGDGLSGDAVITVAGPFQSGDKIYLGTKGMSISGGVAMGSVDIESLLQSEGMTVIYVPGGVDDLKPSTFAATAKLDFDDSDNSSRATAGPPITRGVSVGNLEYFGFTNQGYAYGIVRGGGTDSSHVRVTCESGSDCVIFADCTDQAGMNYFGGPVQIGARETAVVSSDDIAAALGGGWDSGRGRCDMVANGSLSVQHMVRAGHTLINNSVVVNKPVAAFPTIPNDAAYDCTPVDTNGDGEITDADTGDTQSCVRRSQ